MAEGVYLSEGVLSTDDGIVSPRVGGLNDGLRTRSLATIMGCNLHRTMGAEEFTLSTGARPTITATTNYPRAVLPDAATTILNSKVFGLPEEWYEIGQAQFGFEYVNDHTATGNIRFQARGLRVNLALQALSAAVVLFDETFTVASAGANGGNTIILDEDWDFAMAHPTPFDFGQLFCFEVSRIGADAADTLGGSIGVSTMFLLGERP